MNRAQTEYVKSVADVMQMLESDEDYLSVVLDPRYAMLQQKHKEMTALPKRAPRKKAPTKAMKAVQNAYEKEAKMFKTKPGAT